MVKIIYDNMTEGGAKNIIEYWSDKNGIIRYNFLRSDADFADIKMKHITLLEYLKNYGFRD